MVKREKKFGVDISDQFTKFAQMTFLLMFIHNLRKSLFIWTEFTFDSIKITTKRKLQKPEKEKND